MITLLLIMQLKKEVQYIEASMEDVERLILQRFKEEPFHSLNFLTWAKFHQKVTGGSCSDKVQSMFYQLENIGCNVFLHEAYIHNIKCHRVLRIMIKGRMYFADIGNAWPIIKLIPSYEPIEFEVCGIKYTTSITDNRVNVFHKLPNEIKPSHVVSIGLIEQAQQPIKANIANRLSQREKIPFNNKIRFAQMIDNDFLFMKDDTLRIYSSQTSHRKYGIENIKLKNNNVHDLAKNINTYFNIKLISAMDK